MKLHFISISSLTTEQLQSADVKETVPLLGSGN